MMINLFKYNFPETTSAILAGLNVFGEDINSSVKCNFILAFDKPCTFVLSGLFSSDDTLIK